MSLSQLLPTLLVDARRNMDVPHGVKGARSGPRADDCCLPSAADPGMLAALDPGQASESWAAGGSLLGRWDEADGLGDAAGPDWAGRLCRVGIGCGMARNSRRVARRSLVSPRPHQIRRGYENRWRSGHDVGEARICEILEFPRHCRMFMSHLHRWALAFLGFWVQRLLQAARQNRHRGGLRG
jgi:hypothetical protein